MRMFGYFIERLYGLSCLDKIRSLSPNRLGEHVVHRGKQVLTEQVLTFSHQLLFAKLG